MIILDETEEAKNFLYCESCQTVLHINDLVRYIRNHPKGPHYIKSLTWMQKTEDDNG